jgi:HSP90 family molecular chaperone
MFIGYPIRLHKTIEEDVEEEKKKEEVKEDKPEEEGKVEDDTEEKKEEPKAEKKKVKKDVIEHINAKTAIWTRDPKDISEDEYKEFYKQINPSDWEGHLAVSHFRVDGAA